MAEGESTAWNGKYFVVAFVVFLVISFTGIGLIHAQPLRTLWPIVAGVLVAVGGLGWRRLRGSRSKR
ncbi:hypothetical protein OHS18_12770 [Amycolatopsis sp. NBC_00355]|uniref:hypothetical protein n=1 Tax=Amycolatopsis sp. NBC_00355 TaxID=2975957 RepID=UPI002E265EE3